VFIVTRICNIRTSTDKQLIDRQVNQLQDLCNEVFIEDGVSAVKKHRPVYDTVMHKIKGGDVFVVLSLDRAYRSVLDALNELDKLHKRNVSFYSLSQNFDTRTPEGKLLYTISAALAEWERSILSKRTKEGMDAAKKRGSRIGRPLKLSQAQILWAGRQLAIEHSPHRLHQLSSELDVSHQTLRRALKF